VAAVALLDGAAAADAVTTAIEILLTPNPEGAP